MRDIDIKVLEEVYSDYNNIIKPLIAKIESDYQQFPEPLFNEIRAFNDHIARGFQKNILEENIHKEFEKTKSHIKRMTLDCYKYLLAYMDDEVKRFIKSTKHIDFSLIDNGEFYTKFHDMYKTAKDKVRISKFLESECNTEKELIYKSYEDSFLIYEDIKDFIDINIKKIHWARAKYRKRTIITGIVWIISLIVGSIITNNNSKIAQVFTHVPFIKYFS